MPNLEVNDCSVSSDFSSTTGNGEKRMIFVSSEREESVTLSDLIPRPELSIMLPMKAKMIALKMM